MIDLTVLEADSAHEVLAEYARALGLPVADPLRPGAGQALGAIAAAVYDAPL